MICTTNDEILTTTLPTSTVICTTNDQIPISTPQQSSINTMTSHGSYAYPQHPYPLIPIDQPPKVTVVRGYDEEKYEDKQRVELMEKRQASLEEKLRTMLGSKSYGLVNAKDLCFSIGVTLPKDFKIPDLIKYSGIEDPIYHMTAYCVRMGVWSDDEKFLTQFFHESLTGPALQWYLQLDHSKIQSWQDLYDAFLAQYDFNLEVAPTREELYEMCKKDNESFMEYAQRWRVKAAQVKPPLVGHEICTYFLKTLRAPYIQSMAGCLFNDFADIIKVGERVESLVREGILQFSNGKKNIVIPKKKDGDVNNVISHLSNSPYP